MRALRSRNEDMTEGIVRKALSGFCYVQTDSGIVTCKIRGKLRQGSLSPLTGDRVRIENQMVAEILPRKNAFVRPPVANLDLLVIFCANVIPVTEPYLIDRVTAIAGDQNVDVLICVNKVDLESEDRLSAIYRHAGFRVIRTSAETGEGIEELRSAISGKTCALTGNSGVGKSSVLNALRPELALPIGEVSEKLGRGRHTTRHVELLDLGDDTLCADTPGFSAFDTDEMEIILRENLQYAFPDFAPYLGRCQFHDCAHLKEPGCAVRSALEQGEIEPSRYASYRSLYEKAARIPDWERKKQP